MWTNALLVRAALGALVMRLLGKPNQGPVRVREVFEKLGPTYVKLGQLVASSEGMFPDAYCVEFRKCLDRVPSFGADDVNAILREDLKRDPVEVFASFEYKPIASASIAQVHAAKLRDGTAVVIKVQRPRLAKIVAADMRVLRFFANVFARFPRAELANPVAIVEDFQATLAEELDFRNEAANLDEFNDIMRPSRPHGGRAPGRTTSFERTGAHDGALQRLPRRRQGGSRRSAGIRRRGSARRRPPRLVPLSVVHGFFHGDVHAGNLMLLDDGRVGFLDFGIVGRFDDNGATSSAIT